MEEDLRVLFAYFHKVGSVCMQLYFCPSHRCCCNGVLQRCSLRLSTFLIVWKELEFPRYVDALYETCLSSAARDPEESFQVLLQLLYMTCLGKGAFGVCCYGSITVPVRAAAPTQQL